MIKLHNDEKIVKAFEVKKSIHGKGTLYITNYGVYFESQKHGLVIEVGFEWLRSYNAIKKNIFQIVWSTQNNERFHYEINVNSTEAITAYRDATRCPVSRRLRSLSLVGVARGGKSPKFVFIGWK